MTGRLELRGRDKGKKMLTRGRTKTRRRSKTEDCDPAIFDRTQLRQYTTGDGALERELIGLFLGQFAAIRAQLDAAQSADDWKFAAHTLKGSARSIGAPKLAALAESLETMGYRGPGKSKEAILSKLGRAMAAFAVEAEKVVE
jgi:HPt (histidine-containing phosphotransfer) domain-containing protein